MPEGIDAEELQLASPGAGRAKTVVDLRRGGLWKAFQGIGEREVVTNVAPRCRSRRKAGVREADGVSDQLITIVLQRASD